jgi:16S rRNA (uracil1498-N3)-methyltransferase
VNLFYQPDIVYGKNFLEPDESRHCIKVLRHQAGDEIEVTDGKGSFFKATITEADTVRCRFSIVETRREAPKNFRIHIAIAPTKNHDRLEWFVEKCVELYITEVSLIHCDHSERVHLKHDRLLKIAASAMKQSLKATMPQINPPMSFRECIHSTTEKERYIAFVDATNPLHLKDVAKPGGQYLILIGPEGDFSRAELAYAEQRNFIKVTLGSSRLRTETAGIAACHILNLVNS